MLGCMHGTRTEPCVYLDDGHAESRDYDSNYVTLASARTRGVLRCRVELPRPAPGARQPARAWRCVDDDLPLPV